MSFVARANTIHVPLSEAARLRAVMSEFDSFHALGSEGVNDLLTRSNFVRVKSQAACHDSVNSSSAVCWVVSGRIKSLVRGENGRDVILGFIRPGEAFGEASLFADAHDQTEYIATEPTILLVTRDDDMRQHLTQFPQTGIALLRLLSGNLARSRDQVTQLSMCDVNQRLIFQLVALARAEGSPCPGGMVIRHRPTQQELANMIGSCRETVSRAFNQLAREGLVATKGRSMVIAHDLLASTTRQQCRAA